MSEIKHENKNNIAIDLENAIEKTKSINEKYVQPMNEGFSNYCFPETNFLYSVSSSALETMNGLREGISNALNIGLVDAIESMLYSASNIIKESISSSISKIISMQSIMLENISTPFQDWIKKIGEYPLIQLFNQLQIRVDVQKRYLEYYYIVMYDTKWFPNILLITDFELFVAINKIIQTSKDKSGRREKRIDKAFFDHFSEKRLSEISRNWHQSKLDYCVKKIVKQALKAYHRKEYALTCFSLAPMWQNIMSSIVEENQLKEKKPVSSNELKNTFYSIVVVNDDSAILNDFYEHYVMSTCYSVEDVDDRIPGRHSLAHGWLKKYPTRKAALNSILLTNYLINAHIRMNGRKDDK